MRHVFEADLRRFQRLFCPHQSVSENVRFLRQLTSVCEIKHNSLTARISPLLSESPPPVPLAVAYLDADACSVPQRADDTCARLRVVRRRRLTGSPQSRDSSRRGEGLPGYGTVLFVRAMVEHPAGYTPICARISCNSLKRNGILHVQFPSIYRRMDHAAASHRSRYSL